MSWIDDAKKEGSVLKLNEEVLLAQQINKFHQITDQTKNEINKIMEIAKHEGLKVFGCKEIDINTGCGNNAVLQDWFPKDQGGNSFYILENLRYLETFSSIGKDKLTKHAIVWAVGTYRETYFYTKSFLLGIKSDGTCTITASEVESQIKAWLFELYSW